MGAEPAAPETLGIPAVEFEGVVTVDPPVLAMGFCPPSVVHPARRAVLAVARKIRERIFARFLIGKGYQSPIVLLCQTQRPSDSLT